MRLTRRPRPGKNGLFFLMSWLATLFHSHGALPPPHVSEELTVGDFYMRVWDDYETRTVWLSEGRDTTLAVWWEGTVEGIARYWAHIYDRDGHLLKRADITPEIGYEISRWAGASDDNMAFIGDNYLIVFEYSFHSEPGFAGIWLSEEGKILEQGVLTSFPDTYLVAASLFPAGETGLLLWTWTVDGIYFPSYISISTISGDGTVTSPDGIFIGEADIISHSCTSAAAGPEGYLLMWCEGEDSGGPYQLHSVLLDPDGQPLGGDVLLLDDVNDARTAFDGTSYWVTWTGWGALMGQRIAPNGALVDQEPFVIDRDEPPDDGYDMASREGEVGFLMDRGDELEALFLSQQGTSRFIIEPSVWANSDADYPQLVSGGDTWLGGWMVEHDTHSPPDNLYYSAEGALLSSEGGAGEVFPLSIEPAYVSDPRVAFNGENYLVVCKMTENALSGSWVTHLVGAVLSTDGQVLEPGLFLIAEDIYSLFDAGYIDLLEVISRYNDFLVTWQTTSVGGEDSEIWGATIYLEGEVSPPGGISLVESSSSFKLPQIAFDGGNYLLIYNAPGDIYMASRISSELEVISQSILPEADYNVDSLSCQQEVCLLSGQVHPLGGIEDWVAARIDGDNRILDHPPLVLAQDIHFIYFLKSIPVEQDRFVLVEATMQASTMWIAELGIDGQFPPINRVELADPFAYFGLTGVRSLAVVELRDHLLVLFAGDLWDEEDSRNLILRTTKELELLDETWTPLWTAQDDRELDMAVGPGNQALIAYQNSEETLGLRFYTSCEPGTLCDDEPGHEDWRCSLHGVCEPPPDGGWPDVGPDLGMDMGPDTDLENDTGLDVLADSATDRPSLELRSDLTSHDLHLVDAPEPDTLHDRMDEASPDLPALDGPLASDIPEPDMTLQDGLAPSPDHGDSPLQDGQGFDSSATQDTPTPDLPAAHGDMGSEGDGDQETVSDPEPAEGCGCLLIPGAW